MEQMTFGIYPLSAAGTPFGLATGPADDFERIASVLTDLSAGGNAVIPRLYLIYTPAWEEKMLANAEKWAQAGLLADLVLGVGDWTDGDDALNLSAWTAFIRKVLRQYGRKIRSIQICNEPNLSFMEGSKPYIVEALVAGLETAADEIESSHLSVKIGFGSVPESPVSVPTFWQDLSARLSPELRSKIDFVGHNFYVDMFEDQPQTDREITDKVVSTLTDFRQQLDAAKLEKANIWVTENGWATGTNPMNGYVRTESRQAEVLELLIRTIEAQAEALRIGHYALFDLRDADSTNPDLFHQYGILHSDYSEKMAYAVFKRLKDEKV